MSDFPSVDWVEKVATVCEPAWQGYFVSAMLALKEEDGSDPFLRIAVPIMFYSFKYEPKGDAETLATRLMHFFETDYEAVRDRWISHLPTLDPKNPSTVEALAELAVAFIDNNDDFFSIPIQKNATN